MNDQQVIVNGIDIDSGEYLVDDFTYADAVAQAQAARSDLYGETEDQLKVIESNFESQRPHMGPVAGIDARSLEQCGWGIIFAADDPDTDAIVDKLKPLLTRRAAQAGKRFKKYAGDQLGKGYDGLGYRNTQQRADHWLEAHGGSAHEDVDPQNVPYYLLIVGSPHRVPFRFQYELDIQYAVGRIHFDDLDDYRAYAEAVVEAETGSQKRSQSIAMFAPCNAGDVPTIRSSGGLAKPLVERFENDKDLSSWKVHKMLGDGGAGDASTAASKANLRSLLRKNGPRPAFLFTASHGVGMKNYDPSKRDRVGALVCQDWSGRSDNTPSEPPGESVTSAAAT